MHIPLPQYYYVPSMQAELAENELRQRAYEWQACAQWWQAYARGQAYACAQWQAYAEWQRRLLATPSSSCNDTDARKVETSTRKRNRKPTLRSDIVDLKRAGLPIRSIQRTPDGHFIHIGEPIIDTTCDNDNSDDGVSSDPNWP